MKIEIKSLFDEHVESFIDELSSINRDINIEKKGIYHPELQDRINSNENKLIPELKKIDMLFGSESTEVTEAKYQFRKLILPFYSKSYLMNRAITKPQGYAGDFGIIEGVYDNVNLSEGLGFYLDFGFLNSQLAVAVRNRKDLLKTILAESIQKHDGKCNILNIASGSCREWAELLPQFIDIQLELICIDFDQDSLNYSSDRLGRINHSSKIKFVNDNALRMAVRNDNIHRYGLQDIIYSFGLYDYLKDKTLIKLLSKQYMLLKDKGDMLFPIKDCTRYEKTAYDWFVDWKFVQRSADQVFQLLEQIGIQSEKITTQWEPSGTIIFFQISK
jgi:extracellular factor (EF) 3-hydroxypalmitic acid methyl ester biosynthesis protein